MKTNQEIQAEAFQLMTLGSQFQSERRIAGNSASGAEMSRALVNFPLNLANPGRERYIEAAIDGGALVFRLMEREADRVSSGQSENEDDRSLIVSSASAYDVLQTGYEMAEEERLAAALERFVEREDHVERGDDGETAAEIETILETNQLPIAEQLRTKLEIREFLEGRLEPDVLITHAVERQGSRESQRENLAQRHELKLTIGEP